MWYLRIVVAIAGLILFASGCGGGGDAVTPDFDETQYVGIVRGVGTINIDMDDFKFTPNKIQLRIDQKIRIVLNNNSAEHDHGFTVGYGVVTENGFAIGFETDLFEDIEVAVTGPAKMVRSGGAILTREGDGDVEETAGGFMVVKAPFSQATIIEFTVPDTFGDFEFASFESGGKYYDDGMKGVIQVFPKESSCRRAQGC